MVYLHCGWLRTSTSTLQAALAGRRAELAAAGTLYPNRWKSKTGPTHHGLSDLLHASLTSASAFDEIVEFIRANDGRDVLFSAEALTTWLVSEQQQDALLRFVAAIQEVAPVTCIWTMRRLDEAVGSLYLRRFSLGAELPLPADYFETIRAPLVPFEGLRRVHEVAAGSVYVKYARGGDHNGKLLEAFGLPARVRAGIAEDIARAPRLNASLSHKGAVVMLFREKFSVATGVQLNAGTLQKVFFRGDFEFEDDSPCVLVDEDVAGAVHEQGLAEAKRLGLDAYVEFFADDELPRATPVALDAGVVTGRDLERLVARVVQMDPA